jgi:hypothetical protein
MPQYPTSQKRQRSAIGSANAPTIARTNRCKEHYRVTHNFVLLAVKNYEFWSIVSATRLDAAGPASASPAARMARSVSVA